MASAWSRCDCGSVAAPTHIWLEGGARRELPPVSAHEHEVLEVIARKLSNREIAHRLFFGEATVKTPGGNLLAKLDCRDRVHLVICAYEAGLVRPGI